MSLVVDRANAELTDEFAVDGFLFDERLEGVEVGDLEDADAGVVWMFEEDGLAMTAVLFQDQSSILLYGDWESHTRPVAPQHASLASSITTLGPFSSVSCFGWLRMWCATLAPVMPLPMMTTSASVGSSLVERWAVRSAEGSECQKEFVDFSVGRSHGDLEDEEDGRGRAIVSRLECYSS